MLFCFNNSASRLLTASFSCKALTTVPVTVLIIILSDGRKLVLVAVLIGDSGVKCGYPGNYIKNEIAHLIMRGNMGIVREKGDDRHE